jgi:hypothetical protein
MLGGKMEGQWDSTAVFIDLTQAYDVTQKEALYNVHTESAISMKVVRLIKCP